MTTRESMLIDCIESLNERLFQFESEVSKAGMGVNTYDRVLKRYNRVKHLIDEMRVDDSNGGDFGMGMPLEPLVPVGGGDNRNVKD